jgi:hypothetical protein
LLVPAAAHAQDDEQANATKWEGTHVFRRVLHEMHFTPLEGFHQLDEEPGKTILVILGRLEWLNGFERDWLVKFVEGGGAVLLASDRQTGAFNFAIRRFDLHPEGRHLAMLAGVAISGEDVFCENQPFVYKDNTSCPILQPVREGEQLFFRDPHSDEPKQLRVATNIPSRLILQAERPEGLRPVASLPDGSRVIQGQRVFQLRSPLFAVNGTRGKGKFLVLADHSIFINEMMLPDDTGNVEFASHCMAWLRQGGQERDRVLLVEDGEINSEFEVPLEVKPLPELTEEDIRRALANMNQVLAELEDKGTFNRLAWDVLRHARLTPRRLGRMLVIGGTVLLMIYLAVRLMRQGRHHAEAGLPSMGRLVRQQTPTAPALIQRQRALLHGGNLWETAREAARIVFLRGGAAPGDKPPRITTTGNWWQRWRTRRWARRLWELAFGARPVPVTTRGWDRLLGELRRLEKMLAVGTVTLEG